MNTLNDQIITQRIGAVAASYAGTVPARPAAQPRVNFSDVLKTKTDEIRFSAHAQSRLKSRNIDMTPEVMEKLGKAVAGAESKGAKSSLVLLSDLAFIVNIPSKTVITAMDGESIRDNVFTNIDSTVLAG